MSILNQKTISYDFKSTAGKVQKQSEELCLELLKESIIKILSSKNWKSFSEIIEKSA